jgi:Polyketide cyclase / dehydrase and lipid transport
MRRPLLAAAAALLAVTGALAGWLASRPATWRVTAAVAIAAPYPLVVAEVADLRRWAAWSPEAGAGTDAAKAGTFGGPDHGAGQSGYWRDPVTGGQLRITLIEASATRVAAEVEREGSPSDLRDVLFTAEPSGESTRLTQAVEGENDLPRRLLALVSDPDAAEARRLAASLERLRAVAEGEASVPSFRLARSTRVDAPSALVRALLLDPQRFAAFSPWEPPGEVHRSFGGAERGVGASYYWSDEATDRRGRATVTGVEDGRIELELAIDRPRPLESDLEVRLDAVGQATEVTLVAHGELRGADGRAAPAGSLDQPTGRELELGLSRLKQLAEAELVAAAEGRP